MSLSIATPDPRKAHGLQTVGLNPGGFEDFGPNTLRLSPREWLVAGVIAAAAFWLTPILWQRIEPFEPGPDYRMPYPDSEHSLSEDYWMYRRWCGEACREDKVLVLGDSVVWGHYVRADQTLSHYLNERAGAERFVNLGVDGIHPAAMAGLVEHYGGAIEGKRVILFFNPLWLNSDDHDLKTTPEDKLNHARLIPQFSPRIPCYDASLEARLGVVVQRSVPFLGWVHHLRLAYFESSDVAAWTRENPYENPMRAITLELPSPQEPPPDSELRLWTGHEFERFSPPWVDLETSIQWAAFRRTIAILQERGNQVFVLVGPFNEHMLKKPRLPTHQELTKRPAPRLRKTWSEAVRWQRYQEAKSGIAAWLEQNGIPHWVPPALPSEMYADSSHPLADGYEQLARQLWGNGSFAGFLQGF